MIEHIRIKF